MVFLLVRARSPLKGRVSQFKDIGAVTVMEMSEPIWVLDNWEWRTVQTGDHTTQPQPLLLGRSVSPVLADHWFFFFFLDYCVKSHGLKMLITLQIKRGGNPTSQIKQIRFLDVSATEQRGLRALWSINMPHDLGKVCLLIFKPNDWGRWAPQVFLP